MKPILLTLLLALPGLLCAEEANVDPATLKHPVKASLWKIEGKDLKEPSWLFGTIHLGDKRVTTLHPNAEEAFKSADTFYAEIDLDPLAQLALTPMMMRKDGKSLTEAIGPDLTKRLEAALKNINPALTPDALNPLKTWAVAATLPILEMQLTGQQPLDAVLYARAGEAEMKRGGLETAEEQVAIFDNLTEQEAQKMLADSLEMLEEDAKAGVSSTERLLNIYLTGDTPAIAEWLRKEMARADTDPEFTKRLLKALLDDRNVTMARRIDDLLKESPEQSHFFAVGAAHYTGPLAIQDLLAKEGYTITPTFK